MRRRKIAQQFTALNTQDGAGVKMRRLFWREDTLDMDPFLMLDMFDTTNPNDYLKGFPMHPHRGIQTLTYLISGKIEHTDSMGNKGTINDGDFQWMSAGSGILHEEMPKVVEHMMGFQLWINLPKKYKMTLPKYYSGTSSHIPVIQKDNYTVRLLSGEYDGIVADSVPGYIPTEILDIEIEPNTKINVLVNKDYNVFLAVFSGDIVINETTLVAKSGAILTDGDVVEINSGNEKARLFMFTGERLDEPIAWSGPIVMNTDDEIILAQKELQLGTFIKHNASL